MRRARSFGALGACLGFQSETALGSIQGHLSMNILAWCELDVEAAVALNNDRGHGQALFTTRNFRENECCQQFGQNQLGECIARSRVQILRNWKHTLNTPKKKKKLLTMQRLRVSMRCLVQETNCVQKLHVLFKNMQLRFFDVRSYRFEKK